jgi:hypothetical protein
MAFDEVQWHRNEDCLGVSRMFRMNLDMYPERSHEWPCGHNMNLRSRQGSYKNRVEGILVSQVV